MKDRLHDEEAIGSSSSSDGIPASKEKDLDPARNQSIRSVREEQFKEAVQNNTNAKLRNPLAGIPYEQLMEDVEAFAQEKGLMDDIDILRKGALLAQDQKQFESYDLTEEEKEVIRREKTHRWDQPFMMYFMTILCAGSAIVQGMDQTAVNGAQNYYYQDFQIWDPLIQGLVNGAPYLCCCTIGCWTTKPLNHFFGRRGCIFISCFLAIVSGIWMAAANSTWNLFASRFFLGLAVGAKSTVTPVYGAECSPANIRGALVMMWQMWTAFGIMLGFIASVVFMPVSNPNLPGLNWRLMLGSTAIPPIFVCAQVYLVPESPRWYMLKGRYQKAFNSLKRLRKTKLQAARDLYSIHSFLQVENTLREGKNLWKEFLTVPRNRRAAQSSAFLMFMQQFCGVNVIAYYSTDIFLEASFSQSQALLASMGCGIINWVFALPAVYTIDTFGRRNLLLVGYPLMGLCLFWTGFSFYIPEDTTARLASIASGIYVFMVCYSPSSGPVPFTYSAESFPLYVREIGMSFATAICWGFNFILAFTWPMLVRAFTPQGAFGWYAAWNFIATVICYFFLPETKALSLEQLDQVFSVPSRVHAAYYMEKLPWLWKKNVMRQDVEPFRPLYELEE